MDDDDLVRPVGAVRATQAITPVAHRGGNLLYRLRRIAIQQAAVRSKLRERFRAPRAVAPKTEQAEEKPAHQPATSGTLGRIVDTEA